MSFLTYTDINARAITPNDFVGTDSQRIQAAVNYASNGRGEIYIPKINANTGNPLWLLDSAILLPSNMTVILDNCTLKLADTTRDNIFRSNNCGFGITAFTASTNIHIIGIGQAILQGADNPRATGGLKPLKLNPACCSTQSYGTDVGVSGQTQVGDWRGFSILFAYVNNFSIENIKIIDPHCWAITLERCTLGRISKIDFSSNGTKTISGVTVNTTNQDGIDLRLGCQEIVIEDITGRSGDDTVALANIVITGESPGTYGTISVIGSGAILSGDDIYNVTIRNLKCTTLDNSDTGTTAASAIIIGDNGYGGIAPLGNTSRIFISNVLTKAYKPIRIVGSLSESIINNVVRYNSVFSPGNVVIYESGTGNTRNLSVTNVFDYTV